MTGFLTANDPSAMDSRGRRACRRVVAKFGTNLLTDASEQLD